ANSGARPMSTAMPAIAAEETFEDTWPFRARYSAAPGYRAHYVDEGSGPETLLLLHGEPTWSYLYRHVIPPLTAAGLRAVAPDFPGFGKSDKPAHVEDYSYDRLVGWVSDWMDKVDLPPVTLVCQDWGSLVGLRLVGEQPERFARVVVANGFLPTGEEELPLAFKLWQLFARLTPIFPAGWIVRLGCAQPMTPTARAAYDAPYPDERYKAGARALPRLVPTAPDTEAAAANRRAWAGLERFDRPLLTAFASGDPIFRGADRVLQARVPGAQGQPHTTVRRAGHFIQEDQGPELARLTADFIAATPDASPTA
ncbi:MAG: haloalkane dehalogenase, partial [Rhodothermales bacterium]|nr:haloalkane dehalogenase [Rhodothermales bacterium]